MVRAHRLKRTHAALARLHARVSTAKRMSARAVTEQPTRILSRSKVERLFTWSLDWGDFACRLDRTAYRAQRQLDGIYVLISNAPDLTTTGTPRSDENANFALEGVEVEQRPTPSAGS